MIEAKDIILGMKYKHDETVLNSKSIFIFRKKRLLDETGNYCAYLYDFIDAEGKIKRGRETCLNLNEELSLVLVNERKPTLFKGQEFI